MVRELGSIINVWSFDFNSFKIAGDLSALPTEEVICRPENFKKLGWEQIMDLLASNFSREKPSRAPKDWCWDVLLRHLKHINRKIAGTWKMQKERARESPVDTSFVWEKWEELFWSLIKIPGVDSCERSKRTHHHEGSAWMKHLWIMLPWKERKVEGFKGFFVEFFKEASARRLL